MTQLLMYEAVVPVTQAQHRNHAVETGKDYGFSAKLTSVPLLAVEFPEALAEYPIVFAGPKEGLLPVVVLGFRQNENLFVGRDGAWDARYKPAFVRQYPFVFSPAPGDGEQRLILCVDTAYPGFNKEGRGQKLFGADDKPSPYVDERLKFMQEYQAHFQRTRAFCQKLQELDLLEGVEAQIQLGDGQRVTLKGMQAVSRAKMKALSGEKIADLMARDALELIFLHLHSLRNVARLRDRAAASAPPGKKN